MHSQDMKNKMTNGKKIPNPQIRDEIN